MNESRQTVEVTGRIPCLMSTIIGRRPSAQVLAFLRDATKGKWKAKSSARAEHVLHQS